ncbi:MAG: glycosyltransferase family 2 protein [Candidatus Dojkabacteria bacterium]
MSQDKIFIIIPAFNEEPAIGEVIDSVRHEGYDDIIVVNDGSLDKTSQEANKKNCVVLEHLINRGKGAATQTGMDAARALGADFAVTIDADGQHDPKEIHRILEHLFDETADVTLGSRFINNQNIPLSRVLANKIGNLLTLVFYGATSTDTQSGFRGYNKKALEQIHTTFDRFEFESEVIYQARIHQLRTTEVPITVTYSKYSKDKWKGLEHMNVSQNLMNGFSMFFRMVIRSITT